MSTPDRIQIQITKFLKQNDEKKFLNLEYIYIITYVSKVVE